VTERIVRGRILTFRDDPRLAGARAWRLIDDGAVSIRDGLIAAVGETREILASASQGAAIDDHAGKLVLPGLIDAHIHYPQTRVIGSYGAQLLDWLNKYTFVEEQKFADPAHSASVARFFLDELFRQGTTTACVYCTVHPASVDAFFAEAERRGARMIALLRGEGRGRGKRLGAQRGVVPRLQEGPVALTDGGHQLWTCRLGRAGVEGRLGVVFDLELDSLRLRDSAKVRDQREAEVDQPLDLRAAQLVADKDQQRLLVPDCVAEVGQRCAVGGG